MKTAKKKSKYDIDAFKHRLDSPITMTNIKRPTKAKKTTKKSK